MNKQYNVDDILSEIKSKKAKQNAARRPSSAYIPPQRPSRPTATDNIEKPRPELKTEPAEISRPESQTEPRTESVPEPTPGPIPEEIPAFIPPEPSVSTAVQTEPAASASATNPTAGADEPVKTAASSKTMSRKDLEKTGVFFPSLASHRANVRLLEEERLKAEAVRQLEEEQKNAEEMLRQEEERRKFEAKNQELLRLEQQKQQQKQAKTISDLTDSFFLEQQPADLPPQEASTPFGDIEPTTPTPEQPDPSLKKKTEYQKYFSGLERKQKKEKSPAAPPVTSEESAIFDTSSFQSDSQPDSQSAPDSLTSEQEDIFASTPTGMTGELSSQLLFQSNSEASKPDVDSATQSSEKAFHITLPEDETIEQKRPQDNSKSPKGGKKSNLFQRGEQKETPPISRLATAEIPIPEDSPEQPQQEAAQLEDYTSPKDKDAILQDMRGIKQGLLIRMVALVVLFALSLYLALAARDIQIGNELLPLPTIIQPELHLRTYMAVSCIISAIAALICSNTIGGGLLAMLRFRANTDSLPMLAMLGTLAQGICFIVKPEYFSTDKANFGSNLYLFFPVAIFILLFNLVGKMLVILRIQNNFKLVASEKMKRAAVFLKERNLLRDISKGLSLEEYTIAYPETTPFLSNFLDNSYSEDHAEQMSRILAPICLLAGIVLSVLAYLFNQNVAEAVSTFTAIMCISAPLTSTIAANLPLYLLSRRLIPAGAMVSGYSAVDTFSRTEAVVLDAKDLFKPSDVVLHGIKPFDQGKIDSVILDAASVVCNSDGMLTDVFNKIIGSNKSILRPVESVTYEDSMGLAAWVDGKRVLIGNRELMINHGIEVPSNDYEMRFVKDSKNIIYLSNSGQLSAMFVVSYRPNRITKDLLDELASRGMYLIINTSDPNITVEKIHAAYDFPMELIKLLPAKFHAAYEKLTEPKKSAPAKIGFIGSARVMVSAILSCMNARTAIDQAVLIQMIALVVGYALIALFSLMGNLAHLSILHLLLFQGIWTLIDIVVPNIKRF